MNINLLYQPIKEHTFIEKQFDFSLSPDHFMKWLEANGEITITGNYAVDCCSMCEYSCLYVAMMLHGKQLKGELKIYGGNFGFWEHYWLSYKYEGKEYYIDLTLQQFIPDAPKLAILEAINDDSTPTYYFEGIPESTKQYVKRQRAFMFYTNPHTMKAPPKSIKKFGGLGK